MGEEGGVSEVVVAVAVVSPLTRTSEAETPNLVDNDTLHATPLVHTQQQTYTAS